MAKKRITADTVAQLIKSMESAPAHEPKFLTIDSLMTRLEPQIRNLYKDKNYTLKEIAEFFKGKSIYVPQKKLAEIVGNIKYKMPIKS